MISAAVLLFLPGCSGNSELQIKTEDTPKGEIFLEDLDSQSFPSEITNTIRSYFSGYYESLSRLEEKELSFLYNNADEKSQENARLNQAALRYLIGIRQLQPNDLRMDNYAVSLKFLSSANTEDGLLELELEEYKKVNFAFVPSIDSVTSGIYHKFIFISTPEGWKIQEHQKAEDVDYLIEELYTEAKSSSLFTGKLEDMILENITEALLDQARKETQARQKTWEDFYSQPVPDNIDKTWDHDYNRQDAVNYAMSWVSENTILRNPQWLVYDEYGGNCTNYVSQCLLAGGIPMDTRGSIDTQWKWYSDSINKRQTARGRSPSWTGVNEFYKYIMHNQGQGMVVSKDSNYYEGKIGDVILYGTEDQWKHAVLITEVIKDPEGKVVDYLINSNTTDRINYPVSAYSYYNIKLIRILGWNN